MTAIAAALSAIFNDPNLGQPATFIPEDGVPGSIRVIARRPDRIMEFGDARLYSTAAMFDLHMSEVAEPRPGDRLKVGSENYVIQGEPVCDAERLVWTVSAVLL